MSATLEVLSIKYDTLFRQDGHTIIFTQIGNSITDWDIIEPLEEISRQNYWHLEGECGFIGELLGKDIKAVLREYEGTKEPNNAIFIINNIGDEDYYRIQVSF